MKKFLIAVLFMVVATTVHAQEFSIKFTELTENGIVVYYDLVDTVKNRTYSVFVYSSKDNFLQPLTQLSGDAGVEVKPGLNRKIAWDAKKELGATFAGDVELELRGRVYIPFIRFEGFQDALTRKRKTPFLVKWTGGTRQNILNFQLYNGDKLVHTFPNAPNEFQYELEIPNSVKPGSGYYFRIADTKNKDQVVITPEFTVKRKIPLIWKIVPVAVVGYIAYTIFSRSEPKGPAFLEEAPGVPNN